MRKHINIKKWVLFSDIILAMGLVTHSVILLTLNRMIYSYDVSIMENWEVIESSFRWLEAGDAAEAICSTIYYITNIVMFSILTVQKPDISLKRVTLYFLVQLILMFACTATFGVFDMNFFRSYIEPLTLNIMRLILILLIYTIANYIIKRNIKNNDGEP